jgi:hypothetical protein
MMEYHQDVDKKLEGSLRPGAVYAALAMASVCKSVNEM